ncbi:hypothetical protein [Halorubrum yunnanense]|uniref:Uncharacterized protein n=1 Tax=Halorubrum yunnanense TaxID=1526162 RepID=A0ABD5YAJ8_9EURY|nr:hypothetical protein [Halorubrum yunnanense]
MHERGRTFLDDLLATVADGATAAAPFAVDVRASRRPAVGRT